MVARPLSLHRQLDRDRPIEGDDVVVRVGSSDGGIVPATVPLHEPVGRLGDQEVVVARDDSSAPCTAFPESPAADTDSPVPALPSRTRSALRSVSSHSPTPRR